jgi:hypothetical protein
MHPIESVQRFLERPASERRIGPLELCQPLGRGGFAPVWLAREIYGHTELRSAAVKLFASAARHDDAASVVAEARALCGVEHPNVVRFYGLHVDDDSGIVALAMEHVAGTSFESRLAERGRLEIDEVLALGAAIASALGAVHRAGLVHRDVKPANVIDAAGVPKLIDFGIAASGGATATRPSGEARAQASDATTQGFEAASGTRGYVDPVCLAEGLPADAQSDLYGLGATLYRALSGRLPASAGSGSDLVPDVLEGRRAPPPVADWVERVPRALAQVIDALCAPTRQARPPSAEWVAVALEQLRRERAGFERALPPEDVGPFRGLGRYGVDDRDVYFGRTSEVAAALEMLRSRGLVALVGPSGSGKSSLGRAGILPALRQGQLGRWPPAWEVAVVTPGTDARAAIAAALGAWVPDAARHAPDDLAALVAERAASTDRGLLLMVDPLEELVTLGDEASRTHALAFLARLAEPIRPGVRVLCAVRRDFFDPLLATPIGRPLVQGSVLIEPLTDLAWGMVLEQALDAYGYRLEDDALEEELLAEMSAAGEAMPLVQFALAELWDRRDRENKALTRAAFVAMGGLVGALDRHAEATLAALERDELYGAEAARTVLLQLTTPRGTRRTRSLADLEAAAGLRARAVVEAFERARLVVRGPDGITLAHEALLSRWRRLDRWVAEARGDRLLAAELEADARRHGEEPEAVRPWRKHRLAFAQTLLERGELEISPAARAFLRVSRRAERRARWGAAALALGVLGTVALVATSYVRAVQRQERIAQAALDRERDARREAERTTEEVQAAQARIDELLAKVADSATKDEVSALQERIRAAGTENAAAPRPRPAARAPAASASSPAPRGLEVEKTW